MRAVSLRRVRVMLCHWPMRRHDHESMLTVAPVSLSWQYQLLLPPELMSPKYWLEPLSKSSAQENLPVLLQMRWSRLRLMV
jgi:hypothetical protein